jgi:hypothetical protein
VSEYASQHGRAPFLADGRLIARRPVRQGDQVYEVGKEVPVEDMTPRQVAVLWDQGWVDTLPRLPEAETAVKPAAVAKPQPQNQHHRR